jgi:ABC-type transport system involved in multi-copper enzyme maturation permease subunit
MANPIIRRELISLLRQRRIPLLIVTLSLLFAMLVIVRWPTEPRMALSGSRSQEVFRLYAYGLLGTMLLLLPVFPATGLVKERIRGTLALLFNSPLSAWQIYSGKLAASLSLVGLILCLSFPAAAACQALGGVSLAQDLAPAYGVLLLTSVEICALGLLVSGYAMSTDAAIRWTYGVIFAMSGLTMLPHFFFVGSEGWLGPFSDWLRCLSPVAALSGVLGDSDLGAHGVSSTASLPQRFAVLSLLVTVGASIWTMRRLNHTMFDRSKSVGTIIEDQSWQVRALRRMMFIVDPSRRSTGILPFVNPVMMKEFRCRKFGRLHWLLRLVSVCALLALALTILTTTRTVAWDVPTIGGILVLLQIGLLVLITPSLTSGLISAERESGGWVLLQMSPMSPMKILSGKLLSALLTVALVLCATLPGYLVTIYIDPGQRPQVEQVVMSLVLTAVFAMLSSAAVGSLFRQSAVATAAAYSFLLAICAAPLLFWFGRNAPFGHRTVEAALSINPVAAALSVIRVPGFRDYDLIPVHWWFLGIASGISLLVLVVQTIRLTRPA